MSDHSELVERLRARTVRAPKLNADGITATWTVIRDSLCEEAAASLTAQAEEIERLREARLDDLRKLLNALHLGDHARPIPPAEVFQQCLDEIAQVQKEMRAMAHELNALGGKPGAGGLRKAPAQAS